MAAEVKEGVEKLSLKPEEGKDNGKETAPNDAQHEDGSDDEGEEVNAAADGEGGAKKKKKKKNKKKKKTAKTQSDPPRVLLSSLFPNGQYPEGEICEYKDDNTYRTTSEEKRYLDRMNIDWLNEYRQAAEIHRQVRQHAQKVIKPGQTLTEICENIEDGVRALSGHPGLEEGDNLRGGMGFPTGVNLNHIAAHYSPNAGNKTVLSYDDVMKVDFGVHVNGNIID
ncbi:Methionine aminopeptidase 2, partial [Ascosphaera atra]